MSLVESNNQVDDLLLQGEHKYQGVGTVWAKTDWVIVKSKTSHMSMTDIALQLCTWTYPAKNGLRVV